MSKTTFEKLGIPYEERSVADVEAAGKRKQKCECFIL